MDAHDLEMTQVIHTSEESEDEDDDREVQAILKVQLEDTPARFQSFTLKPGVNIVGRSKSCDIKIDVPAVSKQHAQIELCKSDIMITDLGSQNGVKIGKRTLQPRVMYSLDYNMQFSVAGLKAWVLHDEQNGAGGDADSDTCSESLLTAVEIAQDQAGAEAQASGVACDGADRPGNITSVLGPSTRDAVNKATTSSQDANVTNSMTQSSGSFTLPEMPNLDFTQSASAEETEPCVVDGEAKSGSGTAEAAAPVTDNDGGSNAVVANNKHAFLCVPTRDSADNTHESELGGGCALGDVGGTAANMQPYRNNAACLEEPCSRRDEVASVDANESDLLNAPTQGFVDAEAMQASAGGTEYPQAHFSPHDEVTEAANDEVDQLNAPTQGFAEDSIALLNDIDEENHLNAAIDEVDRLNAPTQGFVENSITLLDDADGTNHLNAVTQPYADDPECSEAPCSSHDEAVNAQIGETDLLNAPTQGFGDDAAGDVNAEILAPAAYTSLDEQERLNAITQSIVDQSHDETNAENNFSTPTQPGDRTRRLLSGPCDLSFVLCEASQPCQDDEEEDDVEYCPATQKDNSPGLKVHALLKHGKKKCQAPVNDDDDETPPLSPKTTIDETPPPSPGFGTESDPDSNNVSMVTARHSLSALDVNNVTVYEDCATPDNSMGSPVIGLFGRVSAKRQRSGMSLRKKPYCDIVDAAARAEHQQESESLKACRKLGYAEQTQAGDVGLCAAENRCITTVTKLKKDVQEGSNSLADNASCGSTSLAKGRSPMASIDCDEKDDDAPYLHMSEIEGLDVPATEEGNSSGPCQHSATLEETKNATEGHVESDKVMDNPASPAIKKTFDQHSSHEKVSEKVESAELSSNTGEVSKTGSKRNGRRKQTSKISRTRKKASQSDAEDTTAKVAEAPARRSSGRRNAGSRMKSLLSLEKRTSASGNFHEGGLSEEVSDKQDSLQDVAGKPQDKAVKLELRRGQRGKDCVKDNQEVALLPPRQEASSNAGWHKKDVEESSLKSGDRELPEAKAKCDRKSQGADGEECADEERVMETSVVDSGDKRVEGRVEVPSSLLECKLDCTYATVETSFSEPFTAFSQILEDCQPTAEDGKTEQVETQKQTTTDTTAKNEDEATSSSVHLEQESVAERHHQPSRPAENASNGMTVRKRKEPAAKAPLTRCRATRRCVRESSLQQAEVLAEDTPREVDESGATQPATQQRPVKTSIRLRLARKKMTKKTASEFEVLSIIPETEQPEGNSEVGSLSAQPLENVDEKLSDNLETLVRSQKDQTVSRPCSSKTSRRGARITTEATRAGTDTEAGNAEVASQPGRSTRKCSAHQDSELQNESALDASLKSDLESIKSLSPQAPRRTRKGKKLSQEQNSSAHTKDSEGISMQPVSSQLEPKTARGLRRRGKTNDAVAESTLAESCTETESQDIKTSRCRAKAAALSQEEVGKTVVSSGANAVGESCAEHQLEETAEYWHGRKGTRLPPKKRGLPVTNTSAVCSSESDNTATEGEGTSSLSWRTSARLSQKQYSEDSTKTDVVNESPGAPESRTTSSAQRKRTLNLSQESKLVSEQVAAVGPAKRPLNAEPTSPRMNSQNVRASPQQGKSQETGQRGGKKAAKVSSKAREEVVESEPELSPKPTSELPKTRSSRRQVSKIFALAKAPVTRKTDMRQVAKQEGKALNSTPSTVESLEETSFSCSSPKATSKKRPVASMSFGESRQQSDDDEPTGNDEQTLEEMQINTEPKSRRKAPAKEPPIKRGPDEEPPTKRGKRRGSLPDVVPVERQRSGVKEENADAMSLGTAKSLKRKPKVLFTGIECTNGEEQVVRELGGTVATTASACTHLVTDKFRRTVKSLCCIGKGTPIVDVSWIKKCHEAKTFVDHVPYLLQDRKAEKSLNFCLSETLEKAATRGGVLCGWSIHATAHVQPSPRDMKEIVTCAGGKYLNTMPTRSTTSSSTVVVSCKDDAKTCARAKNNGVPVVSAEFVLSGLLVYKVDVDAHRLS